PAVMPVFPDSLRMFRRPRACSGVLAHVPGWPQAPTSCTWDAHVLWIRQPQKCGIPSFLKKGPWNVRSELFSKRNAEIQNQDRWTLQSKKMLRTVIVPNAPMIATKGAMVAYQGDVHFTHQGSTSVGQFMTKAATGEGGDVMRVEGHGEVFFAREASNIFMMSLEGPQAALTVNTSNHLAFDDALSWEIKRIKGGVGAMASGSGLFNLELAGQGTAAICCKGEPM